MSFAQPDLLARLKQGQAEAFEELIHEYQDRVYGLIRRFIGADAHEADDLSQEVFLRAYTQIGRFRGDSSLGTWLYRVTFNICLDYLRRQRRTNDRMMVYDAAAAGNSGSGEWILPDPRPGPDDRLQQQELQDEIQQALMHLSPTHRLALILHDIHGQTYDEIARITGSHVGTVKSRLFYARQELRRLLGSYLNQPDKGV